jgi:hypothetical protein
MPLSTKRRLVTGLLVVLTIWPLVHLWLARRYRLSSWKAAGWGMYATPRFDNIGMEITGHPDGAAPVQLAAPTPEERDAATRFLESYRWLRDLTPRTTLVETVFATHPDWGEIEIAVFRPDMEADTGMVRLVRASYRHRRGE